MGKNIVLIMTDQQRSDYVSYLKDGKANMPNLKAVVGDSYFTCCQTANPICTPARTALVTGRYTRQIGTLTMSGDLFPQIPTMVQALRKNGYTTFGVGKFHYLQTAPWDTQPGCGLNYIAMEHAGMDSRQFGYDHLWEVSGKQLMITNYCHYARYLDQKGLLQAVRDFWSKEGGENGDTADHNYDKATPWPFEEEDYPDVAIGRKACEQLRNYDAAEPFFMTVSFCGPHKPYDAPQRYIDMFPYERIDDFVLEGNKSLNGEEKEIIYRQRRSYKAMLKLIDDQIGNLIDVLKNMNLYSNTLIIFTSDHGDMLGDHYMIQKGVPWKQALNVPLAIRVPGLKSIGRNDSPVEFTDITATLLDYAGLAPAQALSRSWPAYNNIVPGRSLLPILRGEVDSIRDFAFSESDFTEERSPGTVYADVILARGERRTNAWQAITTKNTKYIKYLEYENPGDFYDEFYDLAKDGDEKNNLVNDPEYENLVGEARFRLMYVIDHYPPCQKTWADRFLRDKSKNL